MGLKQYWSFFTSEVSGREGLLGRNRIKSFKTLKVSKSKSTCSPFFAESLVQSLLSSLNDSHSQREGGHKPKVTMILMINSLSYRDKKQAKNRNEKETPNSILFVGLS